ncbi:MAG TPA: YfhO family protein, partial [Verrucomicrobiae bacterium]|nr:YfhO family protein [Verrucomicrobiae bacterium]
VRRYEELISGTAGSLFFYRSATSLPAALPLLAAKYVLNFNSTPPDPRQFDLVYSNQITIYQNTRFQGRALTVFNYDVAPASSILATIRSGSFNPTDTLLLEGQPPQPPPSVPASAISTARANASAHVISEQPDEVTVNVSMPRPGFLLLLDTYYPGWKATVNGTKAPILRADYDFRAVQLPAGESTVQFVYQPAVFRWGILIFCLGLAIMAAMVWGKFKRHA